MLNRNELKGFLDEKVLQYNTPLFIAPDPISIPHLFSKKEDIEISAFLAATIAWGQRPTILKNSKRLLELMDNAPRDFIINHKESDLDSFEGFVHRTFNGIDARYFIQSLQNIYCHHKGLEGVFSNCFLNNQGIMSRALHDVKQIFFEQKHPLRTEKHVADPMKGSSAKRINMFLRWMVRKDKCGVDFGIWEKIKPAQLKCPLDVHSGNVARKLGLLMRKQNDWRAVIELTDNLITMDEADPVKYDFALFGLGINEKF
ncbi:MAG: TIGR02757 family protein [Bacteroidia bacterium]|nr:TIGR02757 family protein [Bacteroidia bacterium]NNC86432.1 TIGR02757 family protein [Bacteroidia bacterium]NNM16338.1 TIGR02757 family protein [Bacteroidia bacterium]